MEADSPSIDLVVADPGHREFVRSLSAKVFARFGDYATTLPLLMRQPGMHTIIAVTGGMSIGFAMCAVEGPGTVPVDLVAIAVDPAWHSRGVGRRLLRWVEELAVRRAPAGSTATIRLTVAENNAPARGLFEGAGFVRVPGHDGGTYPGGQRSIAMRKRLPRARADRRG